LFIGTNPCVIGVNEICALTYSEGATHDFALWFYFGAFLVYLERYFYGSLYLYAESDLQVQVDVDSMTLPTVITLLCGKLEATRFVVTCYLNSLSTSVF